MEKGRDCNIQVNNYVAFWGCRLHASFPHSMVVVKKLKKPRKHSGDAAANSRNSKRTVTSKPTLTPPSLSLSTPLPNSAAPTLPAKTFPKPSIPTDIVDRKPPDQISDTMPPEETVAKSPLDKPLHQLTEDDISQLTREDCRRYLKQKGMRRPSWNKSQAIQQVISLKMLLETSPDSVASGKRLYIPRHRHDNVNNNSNTDPLHSVPRATSPDAEMSESAEETAGQQTKEADKPEVSGNYVATDNDSNSPRTSSSANTAVGQMTIFYCGKVNVYDDVPVDKAREIMHLAASPIHEPQESSFDCSLAVQPSCHLQTTSVKFSSDSAILVFPTAQTVKMNENIRQHAEEFKFAEDNPVEGPAGRKASVQRYLEKKKDRFKSKKKLGMTSSSSLDVYINLQSGNPVGNEPSIRAEACSLPQIRPLNTPMRCSSVENSIGKNANLSADLSEKDIKQ